MVVELGVNVVVRRNTDVLVDFSSFRGDINNACCRATTTAVRLHPQL